MTSIRERLYVNCPFGKAPSFLSYYLDRLARTTQPEGSILRLEVPLALFGIPSGLNVKRDVVATFSPPESSFGLQRTAVAWAPEGGGPFPTFHGYLSVEQDERYGTSSLLLEGEYEPPLGTIGKAFDAAIGRRIALATAHELLHALRRKIETDWSSSTTASVH
jgi:hypothetical protein